MVPNRAKRLCQWMGTTTIPFEDETVGRIHDSVQGNEKKDYANYNEIQINSERSLIYSLTLYLELCPM